MIEATRSLYEQVMEHQQTADNISRLSVECGGQALVVEELEQLVEEASLKHMLWSIQQDMAVEFSTWLQSPVLDLDVQALQDQVDSFSRQVHRLERGLGPNNLVPKLREQVDHWQVRCDSCT